MLGGAAVDKESLGGSDGEEGFWEVEDCSIGERACLHQEVMDFFFE